MATITHTLENWIERGNNLKCFIDSDSQLNYYQNYIDGNLELVKIEIEYLFCSIYPLFTINLPNNEDCYFIRKNGKKKILISFY